MTKAKGSKKGQAQKHLHARISFLQQAATYLLNNDESRAGLRTGLDPKLEGNALHGLSEEDGSPWNSVAQREACVLTTQVRAVSHKSQIHLSSDVKRTLCKRCNMLLKPGDTSTSVIENASRNRSKPWANTLVIGCHFCGTRKRFPIGKDRARQQKKAK